MTTNADPIREADRVIVFTDDGRWAFAAVESVGSSAVVFVGDGERVQHVRTGHGERYTLRFFRQWPSQRARILAIVPLDALPGDAASRLYAASLE